MLSLYSTLSLYIDDLVRRRAKQVGDGRLADTPGFNQPSFDALTPADLPDCFPEIRARLGRCYLVA